MSKSAKSAYVEKFVQHVMRTKGKNLSSLRSLKAQVVGRYDVLAKLAVISYNLKGSAKFDGNLKASDKVIVLGYSSLAEFKSKAGKDLNKFLFNAGVTTGDLNKDLKVLQKYANNYANIIIAYNDVTEAKSQQVFQYQWDVNKGLRDSDGNIMKDDAGNTLKESLHFKERAINGKSIVCSFNDAMTDASTLGNIDFIVLEVSTPDYTMENKYDDDAFIYDARGLDKKKRPIKSEKAKLAEKVARHRKMVASAKAKLARSAGRLQNLMARRQLASQAANQYQTMFGMGNLADLNVDFLYLMGTPEFDNLSMEDQALVTSYATLMNKGKFREARYLLKNMQDKTFASAILNDSSYKTTLAVDKRKLALRKKINALATKASDKTKEMAMLKDQIDSAKTVLATEKSNAEAGLGVDNIAIDDARATIKKYSTKYTGLKRSIQTLNKQIKALRARLGTYKKIDEQSMAKKNAIVADLTKRIAQQQQYGVGLRAGLDKALANLKAMKLSPAQQQIVKQEVINQVADGADIADAVQAAVQQMPMQATVGQMAGVWDF